VKLPLTLHELIPVSPRLITELNPRPAVFKYVGPSRNGYLGSMRSPDLDAANASPRTVVSAAGIGKRLSPVL
jgi:hypothetical protein